MNFYDNYIALCTRSGKSPSAVALEIGLTKPTITRWKNGSYPTDATMRRVADYFGVSIADLKGSLTIEDVTYQIAKDNGLDRAVALLEKEKPADLKADGKRGAGYYDELYAQLTPENREMMHNLLVQLLNAQAGG